MSTPNGISEPPVSQQISHTLPAPGKRKREDSETQDLNQLPINSIAPSQTFLNDIHDILKSHDPTPSILSHHLPSNDEASEPDAKRKKTSTAVEPLTITSKIHSGSYTSIQEIVHDVSRVSSEMLSAIHPDFTNGANHPHFRMPASSRESELVARVLAFKKALATALVKESMRKTPVHESKLPIQRSAEDLQDPSMGRLQVPSNGLGPSRAVLTLYGNAPQPKQLFSGLQEPTRVDLHPQNTSARHVPSVEVYAPLRELALPNGIQSTKTIPVHAPPNGDEYRKVPTILDLFPPPSTLPQLNPPKPSKAATTRDSTVGWYNPAEVDSSPKTGRMTYSSQPLTTGKWLTYSSVPTPPERSSPEAKRKQRERALSFGDDKSLTPEEVLAQRRAREEALFRRAYSSFAPSRDDSAAIVPEETKNWIWWDRSGEERFDRVFGGSLTEAAELDGPVDPELLKDALEDDAALKEAIEAWEPEDPPADFKAADEKTENEPDERDVEHVLKDISELLETLNSYQRIRHSSLTSASRPAVSHNAGLSSLIGTPTTPSAAETELFDTLKSQLAVLVATLPPYAVAKLSGSQLAELNITMKVPVQAKDYRGVMDQEDLTAAKSKAASLTAAATSNARTSGATPSHPPNSSHYSQRPYAGSTRPTATMSSDNYQTPSKSPSRPASSRFSASGSAYHQARPSTAQYAYPQSTPRSNGPGPPHSSNSGQYFQQPGYNYSSTGAYGTSSQGNASGAYQQPPSQPAYQRHAQQRSQHLQAPAANPYVNPNASAYRAGRSASPQKTPGAAASSYDPLGHQSTQPRSMYATPGAPTPNPSARGYLQNAMPSTPSHTTVNGQTPASTTTGAVGASGFHTYMTATEQANMMERQRAQLAATVNVGARSGSSPRPPSQGAGTQQGTGKVNGYPA
ncbi:MAG: hypothetical protein M1817_004299 [Caeruleum heppii]|nr:MAG: hypothetical protein M1817_004299 [Caeruleum heppii]